jgi:hypothetical protein
MSLLVSNFHRNNKGKVFHQLFFHLSDFRSLALVLILTSLVSVRRRLRLA